MAHDDQAPGLTQATLVNIRSRMHSCGCVGLPDRVINSIMRGELQRPVNGQWVAAVEAAASVLDVEPRFYGCPECTINHPPADCPKLALDREIQAGMEGPDPADALAGAVVAEAIRMQAMQDVIARLDDLGDDSPPWLAPVIAANVAVVSVLDQLYAMNAADLAVTIHDLILHMRPLTWTGREVTR